MARSERRFNKKILALLIEKARGSRSTREYAADCGISYVQLHKLEKCMQDNAPGKKLLIRLAENAEGKVELEEFYFACGFDEDDEKNPKRNSVSRKSLDVQSMYDRLSSGQKKTVYDFVDYLLNYK